MAAIPCQVVPPSQHVPSAWTAAMTARVNASASPPPAGSKRTRTWLRTTSLRIVTPGASRRPSAIRRARAQLRSRSSARPDAAQRPQRGVDGEPAGPPRRLGHPVVGIALAARGLDVVGRTQGHRGVVGGRVPHDDDPGVVGHVEPLVGIGRPRVGLGEPVDPIAQPGGRGRPQAECAVHVQPGVRTGPHGRRDLDERIEGARVHVAGLGAHDRRVPGSRPASRAGRPRASGPVRRSARGGPALGPGPASGATRRS